MSNKSHRSKREAQVFKLELDTFLRTCEAVNTPRSMTCFMLATSGEWEQYLGLSRPDVLLSTFADDYLVSEVMRKNPLLPGTTVAARKAKATSTWYAAEAQCARTNEMVDRYLEGKIAFSPRNETLITKTQRLISDILGPLTAFKLSYAEANFRFGPGSTSCCSGEDVLPSRKMTSILDVTTDLLPYYRVLQPKGWQALVDKDFNTVDGNKVVFVPKTSVTDRAIAIEPHMNIYVQLGVGHLIRTRLKKAGLDLDKGADINRIRASHAQENGDATIDLSSASDTIALRLVELLLPDDWFHLLATCRCEKSYIDGKWVSLEKFSSMGNGYTFELESLIFWALARACAAFDEWPVVFGDDIICSQSSARTLIPLLKLLGFNINEQKTYLAGTFFESCGADYRCGIDVRPYYLKGTYEDITAATIRVANKLRLYAHTRGYGLFCDARFYDAWLSVSNSDRRASRTCVAAGCGNDGLIKNFDEATPSMARHGYAGYYGTVWKHRPVISDRTDPLGAYICALAWGSPSPTSRLKEPIRGRLSHGNVSRQLIPYWRDLGPWI